MKIVDVFSKATWWKVLVAFVLFIIPAYVFVELAEEVHEKETLLFDEAVLHGVNQLASPGLNVVMMTLTQLGGLWAVLVITAVLVVLLWRKRMRRMSVLLTFGVGGAGLINLILKSIFQRDRPELWELLVIENSYSFPSGHAMASSALAFSLIVIFWPTRWRWLVVAIMGVYTFAIGLTRLYLGVHYPTDVVAGWIVSAMWVAVVMVVLHYRQWAKPETKKLE